MQVKINELFFIRIALLFCLYLIISNNVVILVYSGLFMAQTLKKDLRNRIIQASTEEFLVNGYENASMRSIATKTGMTVGNLYRYYKNKEDILNYIVGDSRKRITDIFKNMSAKSYFIEARVYAASYDIRNLKSMFDDLSNRLVEIYCDNPYGLNILLSDKKIVEEFVKWLTDLLKNIIMQNYTVNEYEKSVDLLSKAYAVSIFSGMKVLFRRTGTTKESLKNMLTIFFRGYVSILNADITELIGA